MNKKEDIIYAFFDSKTEDCVYIGIDTNGERLNNHLKPSKYSVQPINKWLQDRSDDEWVYIELQPSDVLESVELDKMNKEIIHIKEKYLINKFKPTLNIYHNEKNKRGDK